MILQEFKLISGKTYLTISYDKEIGCVIDTWQGNFSTQENFRKGLERVVEFIEEQKIDKWLADLRQMEGSFDGSRDWIAKTVIPAVVKAGLLYQAIVLPRNIFSKLSAKDTIVKINSFEIRQFDNIENARNWLKEKNQLLVNS